MKTICIVTTDVILRYQPTILNLYNNLVKHFNVEVISFAPRFISSEKLNDKGIIYLKESWHKLKFYEAIDFCVVLANKHTKWKWVYKLRNNYFQRKLISKTLEKWLANYVADEYITVDFMALYTFQQAKPSEYCHFLSLEILEIDTYRAKCDFNKIISVIIQTKDRYDFLFKDTNKKTFLIQNAPDSSSFYFNSKKTKSLLWAGTILEKFGILNCIGFVNQNSDYTLTFKGGAPKKTINLIRRNFQKLIDGERLVIDNGYLDSKEFIKYISDFFIGFCFYDVELVKNDFNYRTAPSGKLFAYYAACVPVIALNIPGLQSVKEFNAGILIEDYSYTSIYNAIQTIKDNYKFYLEGCKRAAIHFAFDKHCESFIEFLYEKKK